MSTRLSVVIPVYRSQATLPELHRRSVAALEPVEPSFEIILVEDCGGDGSWPVIQQLAQQDSCVRGMKLARNYGQHNALLSECVNDFATPCFINLLCRVVLFQSVSFDQAVG